MATLWLGASCLHLNMPVIKLNLYRCVILSPHCNSISQGELQKNSITSFTPPFSIFHFLSIFFGTYHDFLCLLLEAFITYNFTSDFVVSMSIAQSNRFLSAC